MFDPINGSMAPPRAALHGFTLKDGFRLENDEAELHNGMAVSAGVSSSRTAIPLRSMLSISIRKRVR
jgi:hypothetical protein